MWAIRPRRTRPHFSTTKNVAIAYYQSVFSTLLKEEAMKIKYGLAEFDRFTGMIDWNINLPMDGVQSGFLYEFLRSAGENGWELCGSFPCGVNGSKRAIPGKAELRECQDTAEEIALVFKLVE
jgi:hypothetical protein